MIVLDASAAIEFILEMGHAPAVEKAMSTPGQSIHVPHLIDVEVAHVLRRYALSGLIDPERCEIALSDFLDLAATRYPHEEFLARIWELRNSVGACDAAYVALAESLDAPLLTCDRKLARTSGHGARIELV